MKLHLTLQNQITRILAVEVVATIRENKIKRAIRHGTAKEELMLNY